MKKLSFAIVLLLVLSSCKTYCLTPASLKQQLGNIDPVRSGTAYDPGKDVIDKTLSGGTIFITASTPLT